VIGMDAEVRIALEKCVGGLSEGMPRIMWIEKSLANLQTATTVTSVSQDEDPLPTLNDIFQRQTKIVNYNWLR